MGALPCPALPAAKPSRHTVLLQLQACSRESSKRPCAAWPAGPPVRRARQHWPARKQTGAPSGWLCGQQSLFGRTKAKQRSRAGQQEPSTTPASFSFTFPIERGNQIVCPKTPAFQKKKTPALSHQERSIHRTETHNYAGLQNLNILFKG